MRAFRTMADWRLLFACVACTVLLSTGGNAVPAADTPEADSTASVARTDDVLAVAPPGTDAWRFLAERSAVPGAAALRTSSAGSSAVRFGHGQLAIAGNSQLTWNLPGRAVQLERGEVLLQAERGEAWTLRSGTVSIRAVPPFELTVAILADGGCQVRALRGTATVRAGGQNYGIPAPGEVSVTNRNELAAKAPDEDKDAWLQQARAATATQQRQGQGIGQILIEDAQAGSSQRLKIGRYYANVILQPPVALVQIDQTFYNPYGSQQEGTFVFNLPRGASVSRFAMFVTRQQLIEGEVIERQRASTIYESIVRRRRDPAILEQIGDNLFRMRVFPIFARDDKRVLLDYTVPLVEKDGKYRFELPLLSDLEPIWDFRLTGSIQPPVETESASSPSHPEVRFTPQDDGSVAFEMARANFQPQINLHLDFQAPSRQTTRVRQFRTARPGREPQQYLLATVPAAELLPEKQQADTLPPADVLLLVDTSGDSRKQAKLRQMAGMVIDNLRNVDRFQLGCVDVTWRPLTEDWTAPGSRDATLALAALDRQFPLGAALLQESLPAALKTYGKDSRQRRKVVIYLGPGNSSRTVGVPPSTAVQSLTDALRNAGASLVCVPPGPSKSSSEGPPFMTKVVAASSGRLLEQTGRVAPATQLFRLVLSGLPTPMAITVQAENVPPQDLFHEQSWTGDGPLQVYARRPPGDTLMLKVTATAETGVVEKEWNLKTAESRPVESDESSSSIDSDVFVGRLWAQRKLDHLPSEVYPTTSGRKRAVVALSQEWSLLSPETAFLVLETEQDYARYNIDRKQRQRYWRPAGALPRVPVPLELVRKQRKQDAQREQQQLVDSARRALKRGRPAEALTLLDTRSEISDEALAQASEELRKQANAVLARQQTLARLRQRSRLWNRRLIDRTAEAGPLVHLRLPEGSPEFLKYHPYAPQLLKQVQPPLPRMSLQELVALVAAETKLNVTLDEIALEEEGIGSNEQIEFGNIRRMSINSLLWHALDQPGLTVLETRHGLVITTEIAAEEQHATKVYPAGDLLRTDRLPPLARLAHPFLDLEEASRRQIRAGLARTVNIDFRATPLDDVAKFLAMKLDANVRIDRIALEEEGIALDEPVTAKFRDVPADAALQWILGQKGLTYVLRKEALVLTTEIGAEEMLETQVLSGRGVVYDVSVPARALRQKRGKQGGFGGFGGGGFLGGGGGGFGGGAIGGALGGGGDFGGGIGGFGGFGGGGFGVGGNLGGAGGGTIGGLPEAAGVSQTGPVDADQPQPAAGGNPAADPASTGVPGVAVPGELIPDSPPGRFDSSSSLIDQVQDTTGGPWGEIDGAGGTISYYRPTLSYVVWQTQKMLDETRQVFDQLRQLPPGGAAVQPARQPRIGPQHIAAWDLDPLAQLLMEGTSRGWEMIDGVGGSISEHLGTLSLVIRHSQKQHQQVYRLLTMLRRSHYEARYGRNWRELATGSETVLRLIEQPAADLRKLQEQAAVRAENDDAARQALSSRKAIDRGRAQWRYTNHSAGQGEAVTFARSGPLWEFARGERLLRVAGDRTAVAWPGLQLVAFGKWGTAAARQLDGALPWLPHRSNEELAGLFRMTVRGQDANSTRLRLQVPGEQAAWLDVAFSKKHGLPVAWEAHLAGELQYRLKFAGLEESEGRVCWKTVTAEDPAGRVLERWELVKFSGKPVEILPLADGWEGFLESEEGGKPARHSRIATLLRQGDLARATGEIQQLLRDHPGHPLGLFLTAWSHQADPEAAHVTRAAAEAALRYIARSTTGTLRDAITRQMFPFLTDRQVYDIRRMQPEEQRTRDDWETLARLAEVAGNLPAALAAQERLLELTPESQRFGPALERAELLFRMEQRDTAADVLIALAEQTTRLDQLVQLAEVAGRYSTRNLAETLYARALADEQLGATQRSDLLERRAHLTSGETRMTLLVQAANLQPADSVEHSRLLDLLWAELRDERDPQVFARLATVVKDSDEQVRLLVGQAGVTPDRKDAADLIWNLYQAGRLNDYQQERAARAAALALQYERVITIFERRLRAGKRLSRGFGGTAQLLAAAYEATGREVDNRRARTEGYLL